MEENEKMLEGLFQHLLQFEKVNNKTVNYIYVNANTYNNLKEVGEIEYTNEKMPLDLINYLSLISLAIDNSLDDGCISIG